MSSIELGKDGAPYRRIKQKINIEKGKREREEEDRKLTCMRGFTVGTRLL